MVEAAKEGDVSPKLLKALLALYERTSEAGLGGADMAAVRAAFDK
jgi:hypothetical protein